MASCLVRKKSVLNAAYKVRKYLMSNVLYFDTLRFDPLAGLKTVTSCVRLADLNGDGHFKLCVCDFDKKLKVFKGTSLIVEYALLDVPVALCVVYTELSSVRYF